MTWQIHHGFEVWIPQQKPGCNVPGCDTKIKARGLCGHHYWIATDPRRPAYADIVPYLEPAFVRHWWCRCPDARHDDNECPTCHLVSYSQATIDQFNPNREKAS